MGDEMTIKRKEEDDEIKEGVYIYRYYNAEDGDVINK